MEAPKKIYLSEFTDTTEAVFYVKQDNTKETDIEYTRTDAFIEKACDAYCKVCGHYSHTVPTHICRHDCMYFSDFVKFMKGE